MGLFNLFKRDEIQNENKTKAFHQNANNDERKDWFSRTRPWHKLDPRIIDALIAKYDGDPMFEVFVVASMQFGLVPEYQELGAKGSDAGIACTVISGICCKRGTALSAEALAMFPSEKANQQKLSTIYTNAMNLLESSIALDPDQIGAYLPLATLRATLNKNAEALKWVRRGLAAIHRVKNSGVDFHKSNLPQVRGAAAEIDELEGLLLAMRRELL